MLTKASHWNVFRAGDRGSLTLGIPVELWTGPKGSKSLGHAELLYNRPTKVVRMEEDRMPKKIFTQELEGTRRRGRPRKRWKEEVERDLQVLRVRGRRELVADRKKMEGHCSTGQSPQRAVVPMEEEEEYLTAIG